MIVSVGFLSGLRHQRRAVRNENIFHVVRLAISVQHAGFRIGAHARGADFVNNFSARPESRTDIARRSAFWSCTFRPSFR